jgi:hypothetical protein
MLAQVVFAGFRLGEISCPTRYFTEASSINFSRSVRYGIGVLITSVVFRLQKMGLAHSRIFTSGRHRLESGYYREVDGHAAPALTANEQYDR